MHTPSKNLIPTIVAFLLALSTGLSLVVLSLVTNKVKSTKEDVAGTPVAAAGLSCTDTIIQIALSNCNGGCFVNQDCATGLSCVGAVAGSVAGKCKNPNNPESTDCSEGVGDIITRCVTPVGRSGTFTFNHSYPENTYVMEAPTNPFTITTRVNGAEDARLGGYYSGRGGSGWFKSGTTITTTATQPQSGWCLADVGTYVDNVPVWRGSACRTVTRTVRADDAQAAIFKYEPCTTSNWSATACTYNIPTGAVTPLSVVEASVTNSGTTDTRFSISASGETVSVAQTQLFNNQVAGVTSMMIKDINGNSVFTVPAGKTLQYSLDVSLKKIDSLSFDVQQGVLNVNSVVVFDLATGATKDSSKGEIKVANNSAPVAIKAGIMGTYFDNRDFTNQKLVRNDAQVNFDWAYGSPDSKIGGNTFSVRWIGSITAPVDGEYAFYTQADDGTRLWVNDQQLINDWTTHSVRERSGKIKLEAGKLYKIKLEYFENEGRSTVKLLWSFPGVAKQIVPKEALSL